MTYEVYFDEVIKRMLGVVRRNISWLLLPPKSSILRHLHVRVDFLGDLLLLRPSLPPSLRLQTFPHCNAYTHINIYMYVYGENKKKEHIMFGRWGGGGG